MGQNGSKSVGSGSGSYKAESRGYDSEYRRGNEAAKKVFETERNKEVNFKKRLVSKSNGSLPLQEEEIMKNGQAVENMKLYKKEETIKRQEVKDGISKEKDISENENNTIMKTESTDLHMVDKTDSGNEFEISIAIDFGTTFTGFAYSFRKNKTKIETGKRKLGKSRIPTAVLFKPDGAVDSMGEKAEGKFADLVTMNKMKGYRLFRHFKMALYENEKLTLDEPINDTDGKPMPAIQLFQAVISYMKHCATETVSECLLGETEGIDENILWILTIPAIWSDSARQFMHETAVGAGINEKQLRIVLEPEAASISCKNNFLYMHGGEKLPAGTKYILADLGGGTVDICSHEIMANDCEGSEKIRELFRATGGAFGGTFVDKKFIEFMINVFGKHVWEDFKRKYFDDYLRLITEFETCKSKFDNSTEEFIISIPQSLIELLQNTEDCTLEKRIEKAMYPNVTHRRNKLVCKGGLMKTFFEETVQGIQLHLNRILSQCKDENISYLLLAGGFAESKYVRDTLEDEMKKLYVRVIVAPDPWHAVMKGAVMLSYEDRKIMQRRSKFTYGFAVARPFIEGIHPQEFKFQRDGKYFCDNIFQKLIEKDQYVEYNQEFKTSLSTPRMYRESKWEDVHISVVTSERKNPAYCRKDIKCNEIGKIVIPSPLEGWPDLHEQELYLIVKESKMTCKVVDPSIDVREFDVDFLSRIIES